MNGLNSIMDLHAEASRIFGANAIRELIAEGRSAVLSTLRRGYLKDQPAAGKVSLRELLDWAQLKLAKSYRTEYYYKSVLLKKLVLGVHSPRTLAVFSEFNVGRCRADLVLVNGDAVAYEVKTALDDLNKASRQIGEYYKCFSKVVFVIDLCHLESALRVLPTSVGIMCITNRGALRVLRECGNETRFLSSRTMFSCFRRVEYERVLGEDFPDLDLSNYCDILATVDEICPLSMQEKMTLVLRRRGLSSPRIADIESLPSSLLPAAYLYKMTRQEWRRLLDMLDSDLDDVLERRL